MKRTLVFAVLLSFATVVNAQVDSSLFKRTPVDSSKKSMNMDAVFNRPFLNAGKLPVSLGGYAEVNWQHLSTDGISEGHQFQFRRMSIFMASSIAKRIKFLSEIEFENEDEGSEISIEYAAVDMEFHHLLNLRGGIVLNPIGAFNQNHDGPKWEFTDRPLSATEMLPATWSNAGFGLYGKQYSGNWMFGYELYLTGGFDNSIIDNDRGKTFLPEAKENPERLTSISSGIPLTTAKVALRNKKVGELGLSYMGGVYNKFQEDGLTIDTKRRLDVLAIDANTTLPKINTTIIAEWAWIFVQVPASYTQNYGTKQHGGFMDIIQPVLKRRMFGWDNAVLNVACRLEYIDWNVGTFKNIGGNIGEELWSVVPAVSFRPTQQTVLRLNYRFMRETDLLNNPPATTGGFSVGLSTYF